MQILRHMTNNPRIYLWIALALLVWLNYDAWERDYAPASTAITNTTQHANPAAASSSPGDLANQIPEGSKEAAPASAAAAAPTSTPAVAAASSAPVVHVRTDVLDIDISTLGGTIQRADLLGYPKVKGETTP